MGLWELVKSGCLLVCSHFVFADPCFVADALDVARLLNIDRFRSWRRGASRDHEHVDGRGGM